MVRQMYEMIFKRSLKISQCMEVRPALALKLFCQQGCCASKKSGFHGKFLGKS